MDKRLEKVARQVLSKVGQYVDTVPAESLSPQMMKHITGVLKDLRDIAREEVTDTGLQLRVEFEHEGWNG